MDRRNFLRKALVGAAGVAVFPTAVPRVMFDGAKLTLPGQAYFGDPTYPAPLPDGLNVEDIELAVQLIKGVFGRPSEMLFSSKEFAENTEAMVHEYIERMTLK